MDINLILAYIGGLAIFIYWVCVTTVPKEQRTVRPIVIKIVKISYVAVLILLVFAIALILTGTYFFGKPNIDTSYLLTVEHPQNSSERMYVNIVLSGEVITAQEDLYAFVTVYPNSTWREANHISNKTFPADLLIIFDGALCNSDLHDFELSSACNFQLYFNNKRWTAGHLLSYPSGGEYRIHLAEFDADTMKITSSNDRFIQVESYQVTTEKQNIYVATMVGLASIVAAIIVWWKKRQ